MSLRASSIRRLSTLWRQMLISKRSRKWEMENSDRSRSVCKERALRRWQLSSLSTRAARDAGRVNCIFITHDDVPVECDRLCTCVTKRYENTTIKNAERGGVGSAKDDVCISDSCGVFRRSVAQDTVAADPGPFSGAAEAEPVRPGRR